MEWRLGVGHVGGRTLLINSVAELHYIAFHLADAFIQSD